MAMVRDPSTGEVLALARGGRVQVPGGRPYLDVYLSDGLASRRLTLPVAP